MRFLIFASLIISHLSFGQGGGLNCADMEPICTDAGVTFTANEGGPDASTIDPGNDYGCLATTPNPSWFYLEVSDAGNIEMELSAGSDIDFILWGPYPDLSTAQANCGSHTNILPDFGCNFLGFACDGQGCSYDASNVETPGIENAQVGEVYVLLVTNYANTTQQINLTQTGGAGATDCTILQPECAITYFEANIGACDILTNEYEVNGVIEFEDAPTTGDLIVEDCNGTQHVVASAPFPAGGVVNYTLTNLPANGAACDVTTYFSDDTDCEFGPLNYTAPICTCSFTFLDVNISACDPTDNTFEITGSVEFQSPPTTGQLVIEDCNGNSQTFNAPFTSPTNYALTGIDSDGTTTGCEVTAFFTDDAACTITSNPFDYPDPCVCGGNAGTYTNNINGNTNTNGPYLLCFGDELDITGNGDFEATEDFNLGGVTYDPGVFLFVYDCPPTVFEPDDINTDPCLLGIASNNDQAWTIVNNAGDNSTLWFVPITMYSMVDNIYAISINGGEFCYDMGPVYEVTFLQDITTNIVEDCQAGEAAVTINGGQPSFNGSNFTISNLQPGSASLSSTTVGDGGTVTISGLVDGDNYSFDIVDDSGCPQTISGTFTGTEDPSFDYATDTYCQDEVDPVANITGEPGGTFTATPAGLTINPNTGEIDLSSATGNFTITYTTPDPVCFDQATYDIIINPVPAIDPLADQTACDSYTLPAITGTDLSGNESYYDAPNGGGNALSAGDVISSPGTTTLYIYDETGTVPNCFDEQTFDVTINISPVLDQLNNQVECDSYTLPAITGTNLSGNEAYYDAPNGGGTQYNAGDNITTAGTTTLYIYDETGTTPNCFDELTIDITINPTPVFAVSATNPSICGANDGTITISGLQPNTAYDITYNDNGVAVGPASLTTDANGDIVITGLGAGSYSTFVVSLNGCSSTDNSSLNIIDPNAPSVNAGPDQEVCEGDQVTLTADNPDGAVIAWDNGVNDGVAFTPGLGTTTYTVTADLAGCIATDQVNVTVNPLPTVNAGNDFTICEGEDAVLTGSGADNYVWDNGVVDGVTFNPTTTNTYTVTGTSADGCVDTDDVTITIEPLPTVDFVGQNLSGCAPVTATFENLSGVAGGTCTWNFGDGNTSVGCGQVSNTFTSPGCYDVTLEVTSANGCTSTLTLDDYVCVGAYPNASFTFTPNELTNINTEVDFTNTSNGADSYEWDFGDGQGSTVVNPNHDYPGTADNYIIELVATNSQGCTDTARAIINVKEELIFYVPNTFTPDKDDFNEVFKPIFTSGFDPFSYNLLIFNRWGEIIFESNDAEVGWDGTYGAESDRIVKDGTYVWKITYKRKGVDERQIAVGHVNVLK